MTSDYRNLIVPAVLIQTITFTARSDVPLKAELVYECNGVAYPTRVGLVPDEIVGAIQSFNTNFDGSNACAGGILRAHQNVVTSAGDGETTSGTYSPTLAKAIALARLPAAVRPGEIVQVEIRDKRLPARVVKPPFVRNGEILVE